MLLMDTILRFGFSPGNGTIGLRREVPMIFAKKPEPPTQALSDAGPDELMEGPQAGEMGARTRRPMQDTGTWGDTVYPGCHHTSDPKAPTTAKAK
jgi:hypothetical protein